MENNKKPPENTSGSTNYDLKSDAVEELVNAGTGETPVYSEEELNKYRKRSRFHIPDPVKILFIKAWFAGAVCFFFVWGLGAYLGNLLDMLFVLGVALGLVTDLLTNNVIRYIEKTPGANNKWMLFSKKGMVSFILNILFSFFIVFCVYLLYNLINLAIITVTGNDGTIPLGVEPILFGVFCMGIDMLFVGIKALIRSIITDAKYTAAAQNNSDAAQ